MTDFLSDLAVPVLALPRTAKRFVALSADVCLCVLTVWLAFYLRLGEFISFTGPSAWAPGLIRAAAVAMVIALPVFVVSGLYRAIFRYSGWPALVTVARAIGVYGLIYAAVFTVIGFAGIPRTVGIIQPILLLLFVGASRAAARLWLGDQYQGILRRASRPKVLIYGAGSSGRQLAAAMGNSPEMKVVGFLDDDDRLHGHVLNGLPVYAPGDLADLVSTLTISEVLLAMPGLSRYRRNEILNQIRSAHVAVHTLPSVADVVQGKISFSDLQELDVDDLLGRDPVTPNHVLLVRNNADKVVLVTGAGGSIGSELCRQILATGPEKLILIEQSEFALYAIHHELEEKASPDTVLVPLLATVQDTNRLGQIFSTWRPDTVYHSAAYKHVPLVEHNPAEGISNNVFGTLNTALAAANSGVSNFVLVSTDKAVRPTNVMGASKRLAEMILQALAENSTHTKFSMVRFGNVLDSSGSVVPKFRQQIRAGGPVTVTHPDVTRYFMTIPEAAQLVVQAGAMARGGDVFVLDMGSPVQILQLARRMIELSGLTVKDEQNPEGDIEIKIVGLRPGEKLYEELLIGNNPESTAHPRVMKAHEEFIPWPDLEAALEELQQALLAGDTGLLRELTAQLVSGYTPKGENVDWVSMERVNTGPG